MGQKSGSGARESGWGAGARTGIYGGAAAGCGRRVRSGVSVGKYVGSGRHADGMHSAVNGM